MVAKKLVITEVIYILYRNVNTTQSRSTPAHWHLLLENVTLHHSLLFSEWLHLNIQVWAKPDDDLIQCDLRKHIVLQWKKKGLYISHLINDIYRAEFEIFFIHFTLSFFVSKFCYSLCIFRFTLDFEFQIFIVVSRHLDPTKTCVNIVCL